MSETALRRASRIEVLIEIPKGSRNKYEFHEESGEIRLDRVLYSSVHYPTDYGFIKHTHAPDGDHLDVLVFTHEPTFPGCVLIARAIGVLRMRDDKGEDDKILAVPIGDPRFDTVAELRDISPHWLLEIENFFATYKRLEDKATVITGWGDSYEAVQIIQACRLSADQLHSADSSGALRTRRPAPIIASDSAQESDMSSKEFIRSSLEILHQRLNEAVQDLTAEQINWRPKDGGSAIAFMIWHYTRTEDNLIQFALQRKPTVWQEQNYAEKFGLDPRAQGTGMTAEQAAAVRLSSGRDFLPYMQAVWKNTEDFITNISDAELAEEIELRGLGKPSRESILGNSLMTHGYGHLGEIWYVKGLQGLPGSPI